MANKKTLTKIYDEILLAHPEFNTTQLENAVFLECFEHELDSLGDDRMGPDEEALLRSFAHCFWSLGGLFEVHHMLAR